MGPFTELFKLRVNEMLNLRRLEMYVLSKRGNYNRQNGGQKNLEMHREGDWSSAKREQKENIWHLPTNA